MCKGFSVGFFRRHSPFAVVPLLGWIFVQLLSASAFASMPSGTTAPDSFDPNLSYITICTPEGLKLIQVGDGEPADNLPSTLSACEWCRALDFSVVVPYVFSVTNLDRDPGSSIRFVWVEMTSDRSPVWRPYYGRGPPA